MAKSISDIKHEITALVMTELQNGRIPWQKPWNALECGDVRNMLTNRSYTGINPLILSIVSNMKGFKSPLWGTFANVKKAGGNVEKGQKSTMVVFWTPLFYKKGETNQKTGSIVTQDKKEVKAFMLKHYNVFNIEQTSLKDDPKFAVETIERTQFNPIENGEAIINGYKNAPKIIHGDKSAYYSPSTDTVGMPDKSQFIKAEGYYSCIFHELMHSTGSANRLKRKEIVESNSFGSHAYSREELVAEFGATMLCAKAGIEGNFKNNVAYIKSWMRALQDDEGMLLSASSRAEKAVNHILG